MKPFPRIALRFGGILLGLEMKGEKNYQTPPPPPPKKGQHPWIFLQLKFEYEGNCINYNCDIM